MTRSARRDRIPGSRLAVAALAAAMTVVLAGPVRAEMPASVADGASVKEWQYHTSRKLDGVALYVGTQLLQTKQDADIPAYSPILLGLENLKYRGVTVERDRIRLYDRYGTELPLASLSEVRSDYARFRQDRQFLRVTNFGGHLERTARLVATNFFPIPGEIGVYRIQVPQWGKMVDLLYFKGRIERGEPYRLVVDVKEDIPDLSIEFSVP